MAYLPRAAVMVAVVVEVEVGAEVVAVGAVTG